MQVSSIFALPLVYFTTISPYTIQSYWSVTAFILGLVIVLLLMKKDIQTGSDPNAIDGGLTVTWIIAGTIMAFISQNIAGWIEIDLLGIEQGSENTEMIMDISKANPIFVIIPMLIAPILEEILFRKIIFGSLYQRMNFFFAALLSALAFGIIHMEPEHILIYAAMGFVLAFIYIKTKRIIAPILIHMVFNSIAILVPLLIPKEKLEEMTQQVINMYLIFIGG